MEIEQLKDYILDLERRCLAFNVENYLKEGWALRAIKDSLKSQQPFLSWVEANIPFSVRTAERRLELYDTVIQRQITSSNLSNLDKKLLIQIKDIWHKITGYEKPQLQHQKRLTDIFIKKESRKLARTHVDEDPYYNKDMVDSDKKKRERITKHKRNSYDIEDTIENTAKILMDWINQFKLWKETIIPLNLEELNDRKRAIEKKIVEIKKDLNDS